MRLHGKFRDVLGANGRLFLGVDLKKDAQTLVKAYNDRAGVTAAFNLNVLRNVNALIDADFDVADWRHIAFFDPVSSRIEMHLEARFDVTVRWNGGQRHFRATDRIHTENSYKYTQPGLRALLKRAGFDRIDVFTDEARSFAVAVAAG